MRIQRATEFSHQQALARRAAGEAQIDIAQGAADCDEYREGAGAIALSQPRAPRVPLFELITCGHTNENGLIMHNFIVSPPNGDTDWRRFIEAGTNIQVSRALDVARRSLMSEMTNAAGDGVQDKIDQFRHIYVRHAECYQALCAGLSGSKYTTKSNHRLN